MRSRRVAAVLSSLAVVAVAACEGNPPARTGQTMLDFGTNVQTGLGGQPQLVWRLSKYAGSPFFHWDFRDWELKGNPLLAFPALDILDLPGHTLTLTDPLFMRYASSNAFWFRAGTSGAEIWDQHEIELFARDPEEHFRSLFDFFVEGSHAGDYNDASFDGKWNTETTTIPGKVPYVPYVLYPGAPNANTVKPAGPDPVVVELARGAFLDSAKTEISATVKAAKIIKRGICSKFWDYSDLLPKIDDAAFHDLAVRDIDRWTGFSPAFDCFAGVPQIRRRYANLASFVHLTTEREDAQFGGFFFNTNIGINTTAPSAAFHNAYWFRLVDGRLGVEPQMIGASGNDDGERIVHQDFMTQSMQSRLGIRHLGNSVADVVWGIADDAQVFTTNKVCTSLGQYIGDVPCTPASATSCVPTQGACGGFVKDVLDGAVNAANQLAAFAFTSEDIDQLKATVLEREPSKTINMINAPVFKNFRCVERLVNNSITPVCEYILRAKRINVFPNGVSLVYLDDHHDLRNPVYPIWLQFWAQHQAGVPKNQDPLSFLCDAPESQPAGQLFARSYLNVRGDCTDYACAGPTLNMPKCDCSVLQVNKCK